MLEHREFNGLQLARSSWHSSISIKALEIDGKSCEQSIHLLPNKVTHKIMLSVTVPTLDNNFIIIVLQCMCIYICIQSAFTCTIITTHAHTLVLYTVYNYVVVYKFCMLLKQT